MMLNILLTASVALLVVAVGFQIAKTCAEISKKNKVVDAELKDALSASDSELKAECDGNLHEVVREVVDEELDKRGLTDKNAYARTCDGDSDIPEEAREDVIIIPRVTLEEVAKTEDSQGSAPEEIAPEVKEQVEDDAKEEQTITAETAPVQADESAEEPTDNGELKSEEEIVPETEEDEAEDETEEEEDGEEAEEYENADEDSVFSKIVRKPRVPFAKKILESEDNIKSYYDGICNAFNAYKHVGCRVSKRSASFRYHRELIAKITVHGKTVKLNLALDPKAFGENIYHQKDLSEKKAYEEVPFTLKLKSDRSYKHAVELVGVVAEKVGAEKKTRVNPVDYLAKLREKLN